MLSIEDGAVIDTGVFTSSEKVSYWNTTYYVLIRNDTRFICKYAELDDVIVKINGEVSAGALIGHVGLVLNEDKITEDSPLYIQKLNKNENRSMLHFELYKEHQIETTKCCGGNCFSSRKPKILLDPTQYLQSTI